MHPLYEFPVAKFAAPDGDANRDVFDRNTAMMNALKSDETPMGVESAAALSQPVMRSICCSALRLGADL